MTAQSRSSRAGRKASEPVQEAARRVEKELREIIHYLDRKVVPKVRYESERAMRTAARKLEDLADYMERQRKS